ncbi:MAG: hypothetical protein IIA60_06720 [Candidatus Marinimicrobia bacterium]|nr:hypothetical protein [Candidatus Neomarinimicrobiota bacterium]
MNLHLPGCHRQGHPCFSAHSQTFLDGLLNVFLGLLLGATGGVVTGVAIKGLIGDPLVSGGGAVAFYATFSASSLITLFVMLNYLMMSLQVSKDGLDIKFGMKTASVERVELIAVRVADTRSRMSRALGQDGRKISQMWTVLGVGSGIEIDVLSGKSGNGGKTETWFISSRDPAKLAERLASLIKNSYSLSGGELEDGPSSS